MKKIISIAAAMATVLSSTAVSAGAMFENIPSTRIWEEEYDIFDAMDSGELVTDIDQDPRALGKENDLEFPKEDLQAGGLHTSLVTSKMTLWGLWVLSQSSALLQLGNSHPPSGVSPDSLATHLWSRGLTRRSEGRDRNMEKGIKKSNI